MKTFYTAHQIYKEKKIYWIGSYKAILKYMRKYEHILKPITTGSNCKKRYYVSEKNMKKFVSMFENNKLK